MTVLSPVRLPLDLYSPEQLSAVIIELRSYVSDLRDAAVRAKTSGHNSDVKIHASALVVAAFHEAGVDPSDPSGVEKLLKQFEAIRDKAPVMHILLAALPNRELKRKFTDWFRSQIHPYSLLTFATRTDIGGGVIVQAGSHIYDYSFRQQILSNKLRISEIYASVSK